MSIDPNTILAAAKADEPAPAPEPPRIDTPHHYTTAYTDGSSTGGWGPGGWAWVVIDGPFGEVSGSGGSGWTTNQRMELQAAHEAMRALSGLLLIVSDSEYVIKGFTLWGAAWRAKGYRKVSNADLWQPAYDHFTSRRGEVKFAWVKGHTGLPGNERADELAVAARLAVPFAEWGPTDPVERAKYLHPQGRTANGKATRLGL